MEVIEIISHYIDKTQNLIIVEFKMLGDDDDTIREDFIEYSFYEEFGFDNSKDFKIFEDVMEEDEWEDDQYDYINDDDNLLSFLNEYYVVFPKKIPKAEIK
jgi:hypothetical protein